MQTVYFCIPFQVLESGWWKAKTFLSGLSQSYPSYLGIQVCKKGIIYEKKNIMRLFIF